MVRGEAPTEVTNTRCADRPSLQPKPVDERLVRPVKTTVPREKWEGGVSVRDRAVTPTQPLLSAMSDKVKRIHRTYYTDNDRDGRHIFRQRLNRKFMES